LTLIAYWGSWQAEFIYFDDPWYVVDNDHIQHGFTGASIRWAFTTFEQSNWHPLTWLSHTLDVSLFGLNSGRHHAVNLAIHVANVLLLFWLWVAMTRAVWPSAMVAALFAVHPMHVESVAWVAERKDLLSTLLMLLSAIAYVRYVRQPRLGRYAAVVGLFAMALMAKPMPVTLPCLLLVLDYWPLARWTWADARRWSKVGTLVAEKVPLLMLSAASSVVTYIAQQRGGSMTPLEHLSLWLRLANVPLAYVRYVYKAIWPANLAVFYPYDVRPSVAAALAALVLLSAVSGLAVWAARRGRPYLATGWFWFLGTLVPAVGIVQVGEQAMADRYTYIPFVGLFVMVVWGVADLCSRHPSRATEDGTRRVPATMLPEDGTRRVPATKGLLKNDLCHFQGDRHSCLSEMTGRNACPPDEKSTTCSFTGPKVLVGVGLAAAALAACVVLTAVQVRYWNNTECLLEHALAVAPASHLAHNNLGVWLWEHHRVEEALGHWVEAIRIAPKSADAFYKLGFALARRGRLDEARDCLSTAVRLAPSRSDARYELAEVLWKQGKPEEAIAGWREILATTPTAKGYARLGRALLDRNEVAEAARCFAQGVACEPEDFEVRHDLGLTLWQLNQREAAVSNLTEAIRLQPTSAVAHANLATIFAQLGQLDRAAAELQEALRFEPTRAGAADNLARIYQALGRTQEAAAMAAQAEAIRQRLKSSGTGSTGQASGPHANGSTGGASGTRGGS
jgi:tetratricopeptide (TPR) repeat protein